MNRFAVDDDTLEEIELAVSTIYLAQEDFKKTGLKPNEKKSLKAQIRRAHASISKLLSKTVDPTTIVPNGSERVTQQLTFFLEMENNLLKMPDINEAIKKLITEKIEAIQKLKQVNLVIKKKNNKEGLRVHEEK